MSDKGGFTAQIGVERKQQFKRLSQATGQTMTAILEDVIESASLQLDELQTNGDSVPQVEIVTKVKRRKTS